MKSYNKSGSTLSFVLPYPLFKFFAVPKSILQGHTLCLGLLMTLSMGFRLRVDHHRSFLTCTLILRVILDQVRMRTRDLSHVKREWSRWAIPVHFSLVFSQISHFLLVRQVLRSLAPSKTIECTHFCGEYIFYWAMQNGCPSLIASNMTAPWRKVIWWNMQQVDVST